MPELPVQYDIQAYRGDTTTRAFRFGSGTDPVDLSAAQLKSEAREDNQRATKYQLTVSVIDAANGQILLSVPETLPAGNYVYDIEVQVDTETTTWIRGHLYVVRDVTNEPAAP